MRVEFFISGHLSTSFCRKKTFISSGVFLSTFTGLHHFVCLTFSFRIIPVFKSVSLNENDRNDGETGIHFLLIVGFHRSLLLRN